MEYLNYGMISKSGHRFSDEIMPKHERRDVIDARPD
jgi:hypothetical protein